MNKRVALYIVLAAVVFVAALFYGTMSLRQHRVEVCITFQGRTACRVASGASKEEAARTATDNACALLASGVTETMACGRTAPDSVKVLE